MTPDTQDEKPRRRRARLKHIRLDELSLVDRGANPHATVALFKRRDDEFDKLNREEQEEMPNTFDDAWRAIEARDGVPGHAAMRRAREAFPDLFEKYQREGAVSSRPTFEKAATPDAVRKFDDIVDRIMRRDDCSRLDALRLARTEEPEAFRRYQAA